jgi:hypothetical protein
MVCFCNEMLLQRLGKWLVLMVLAVPFASTAGEGAFGWIYTLDLQPKGTLEFEQRLQRNHRQASGKYDVLLARSELEYGLTDNLQIAGYVNSYAASIEQNYTNPQICGASPGCTSGFPVPTSHDRSAPFHQQGVDGYSFEAIYRLTNPVIEPLGIGFYAEPTFGKLKNELEARLILQSNFLDDRLIVASNIVFANEQLKFLGQGKARWHNDFARYNLKNQTQRQIFFGPNLHFAEKDWWVSAAWRYQPKGGKCYGDGTGECSEGRVWDSHSRNEMIFKVGMPIH